MNGPGPLQRILLVLENRKNRELLAEWLSLRHSVWIPEAPDQAIDAAYDLAILDGAGLRRYGAHMARRKAADAPVFLPVMLLTSRRDIALATRHLWESVDELIVIPVDKVELQARVEVLLRSRGLSLELKLRNDDLESFIHAMTHDLRAPARAIEGFAEALADESGAQLNPAGRHYLDRIRSANGEMLALMSDLLEFSRLGRSAVELQTVPLQPIVEGCLRRLQDEVRTTGARVTLVTPLPDVKANPTMLKIAVTNLLSNALKFVAPGVTPDVRISAQPSGLNTVRLCVEDNGIGIGAEDRARLFTPFVRLHGVEEYPGTGLGLATVRKAVDLMGGRTGVQPGAAGGCLFWIDLVGGRTA